MTGHILGLVSEADTQGRLSEQGARSEAECSSTVDLDRDCVQPSWVEADCGGLDPADADCGQECLEPSIQSRGGGDGSSSSPSFLVLSKDNVNAYLWRARGLLVMWDFLEHKGRIGTTQVVLSNANDPEVVRIMPASLRSRYYDDGRLRMAHSIRRRLGKFDRVPGLMQTLTYDPKSISKQDAWASYGRDTRRFINAVNQYRRRRGWRRLHYLWVVEVQEGTGYPHVHIFFPKLRWLAPLDIINGNWRHGRANIESPKKIRVNCAAYISKYLRKMNGWSDLHLALLWAGKSRMYGFSRGFSAKQEKPKSDWRRLHVVRTNNVQALELGLMRGGHVIDVVAGNGRPAASPK